MPHQTLRCVRFRPSGPIIIRRNDIEAFEILVFASVGQNGEIGDRIWSKEKREIHSYDEARGILFNAKKQP